MEDSVVVKYLIQPSWGTKRKRLVRPPHFVLFIHAFL